MQKEMKYGIKLSLIYGLVWFSDLLDATTLNVALPEISKYFTTDPTDAEWALIGFLLAMMLGMLMSNPVGRFFGMRPIYISAQWVYLISSIACGFAINFQQLVVFRIFQGLGGGLALPLGMTLVLSTLPTFYWSKAGSWTNLFALIAPALGPLLAGYTIAYFNWRWLFFIKLPLPIATLILSYLWITKTPRKRDEKFDWLGFYFLAFSLGLTLLIVSEIGKPLFSNNMLFFLAIAALVLFAAFMRQEKKALYPIIPFKIFRYPLYAWGNVIQSAANIVFLGSTFIIALYLQWSLGWSILKTGWIMSAVTLGMIAAMPCTASFYNKWGPRPFIIFGLLLMASSMFAFLFVTETTSPLLVAFIIFIEGCGSAALQTTNFVSIFSELPHKLKGVGSSLYSLLKPVSASFGIALSTMALSLVMKREGISRLESSTPLSFFYPSFLLLGAIPLFSLLFVFFIDNHRALKKATQDHLETEFEEGAK